MIKENDISYSCGYNNYMMKYKNKPIGGGASKTTRKLRSNVKFYQEQAEITKRDILAGKIPNHMKKAIKEIDSL